MKILWIVGFTIPKASELIGSPEIPFGGWVSQMINQLSTMQDFDIAVAMKSQSKKLIIKEHDNVTYYYMPQKSTNKFDIYKKDCDIIINDFKPDLVHAEGTEQAYTNTFLKNWNGKNVVSLQGVINGYEPYEYGGLKPSKYIFSFSLKNIIFGLSMVLNKKLIFNKRIKIERETIGLAQNILGRTIWDRSNSYFFNTSAKYYSCNRILRPVFYTTKHNKDNYKQYSIFIGNSAQVRKGAHFVLEAIKLLKNEYPNIKLYIAGHKMNKSLTDWKSHIGYRGFLFRMIKKLHLENHVEFLGSLQESEMAETMSKMHIYVMSSVIENSPNTLGEAMIIGLPSVASYNGGVSQMANDEKETLLYRDNDPNMLAYQIKRLFDDDKLVKKITTNAIKKALVTHDTKTNLDDLINCYNDILKN